MRPETLLFWYMVSFLAAISGVAIYSHFRRKRFEPTPSADNIFRCERCGFVYTDDSDVDRSRCPQCGLLNTKSRF
jgi:rubrerythrin